VPLLTKFSKAKSRNITRYPRALIVDIFEVARVKSDSFTE